MPRRWTGSAVASAPAMTTRPLSGASSPAITRSRVDLPEPLGPSSAVSAPSGAVSVTSSRARKAPKLLVTASTEIMRGPFGA
jgi:hypothetical protein